MFSKAGPDMKKAISLIKKKYAENPFANEDGFSVPIRKKTEVIQTEGPASVTVGDEKIAVAPDTQNHDSRQRPFREGFRSRA